ncbi:MAG: hypothetical protein IPI67_34175 [Myxococcales bacterium]|nr:hypothetical protein [Myxococcales bacterium]
MRGISIFLILAGFLQLWAGVAAAVRKGELKTTQGRQLEAALGRKGTVAFFLVLGALLTSGGLFLLIRSTL